MAEGGEIAFFVVTHGGPTYFLNLPHPRAIASRACPSSTRGVIERASGMQSSETCRLAKLLMSRRGDKLITAPCTRLNFDQDICLYGYR
jgi:hypothetical protein